MDDEMGDLIDPPEADLFARLTPEGQRLVPVPYRFLHASPLAEKTLSRLVESRPYRTTGYVCWTFRKPISKCCGPDD